jgi:hypothetical protein
MRKLAGMSTVGRGVMVMAFLLLNPGPVLAGDTRPATSPTGDQAAFRIGSIHAHLFYESLGQLDDRELAVSPRN